MQSHSNIPLHIVPAYGRDYLTSLEVLAAWKAGRDFLIRDISSPWDGCYCSCRDFTRIERVMLRFNHLEDFVITGGLKPRTERTWVPPAPKRLACVLAILIGFTGSAHAFCNMPYNPNGPVDYQTMQLYDQCQKLEKERMPTSSYYDCSNWAIFKSDDPYALEKCHRLEGY